MITHETILDEDDLYRRIVRNQISPDGRVNSAAFKRNGKPNPEVSVDLARMTSVEETATRAPQPGAGVGSLRTSIARGLGLEVKHAPVEGNDAHSLILGLTKRQDCTLLAEATQVILAPSR